MLLSIASSSAAAAAACCLHRDDVPKDLGTNEGVFWLDDLLTSHGVRTLRRSIEGVERVDRDLATIEAEPLRTANIGLLA